MGASEKKILLVEDNPDDVELTLEALRSNHVQNEVVHAWNGVEALDYLFGTGTYDGRDTSDQPVLVLLDLNLPKVGGIEVLRRMRGDPRTRMLPVVVLTSSKEDVDVRRAYALGANTYLAKPVALDGLIEMVRTLGLYWFLTAQRPVIAG